MRKIVGKGLARLGRDRPARAAPPDWPEPRRDAPLDTPFLVLLTPPNSGSTAIADFVCQIDGAAALDGRFYEGQWLIRGLAAPDRWWPEKFVDYRAVCGCWGARIEALRAQGNLRFVFEKSPPHLVRYRDLRRILADATFVVNNRDPYANIASQLGRYGARDFAGVARTEIAAHYARLWLWRSRFLRRAVTEDGYELLTYEDFCAAPARAFAAFGLGAEGAMREDYSVRVKDYGAQAITNMNDNQIARLAPAEHAAISRELAADPALLDFFGYGLRDTAAG